MDNTVSKEDQYREALQKIVDQFDDKLNLHKEDCFAYNTAKEVLSND